MKLVFDKMDLLRGTILTFLCFGCSKIEKTYVSSQTTFMKFKKMLFTKEGYCINCNSPHCYVKDVYGREIDNIEIK